MPNVTKSILYGLALSVQTASALMLFCVIFPSFHRLFSSLGEPQQIDRGAQLAILFGVTMLQSSYWLRLRWLPVIAPMHSVFFGHVVLFAGRVSFFFGGALFSTIFFRHVPDLEFLPPLGQSVAKAIAVLAILFSLFCYSLELERLGKAIEDQREA
ncbi:hypothetical protein [Kaistia terrae]|uniref:DUF2975 domain-containing protein n=1 Tax=Kaistia terrae TaxID=537017 RepID=A0ABW0Q294_9HYPH|nr:hypothetical protein [Kaistia terrae]MCX5581739.1 hypothetical protein [Kaistia terrae]